MTTMLSTRLINNGSDLEDAGVLLLMQRSLQDEANDSDGNIADGTDPPDRVASTVILIVLLLMLICVSIFFCCASGRDAVGTINRRQNDHTPTNINRIDGMTKAERREYLQRVLKTKKYEGTNNKKVKHGSDEECFCTEEDGNATVGTAASMEEEEDAEYSSDQCAICLLDYEEGDEIAWSQNCEHYFHRQCVVKWLMKHQECPYCRRPYLSDEENAADEENANAGDPVAWGARTPSFPAEDTLAVIRLGADV